MADDVRIHEKELYALYKSPGVVRFTGRTAEKVAAQMRSTAPVETGAYRDGITVVQDDHPTRVAFHVGSTVGYADIVEADHGTAVRALDAAR